MPNLPKNSWPNTDLANHYLLFAQTLMLLLSESAFESFRAPVLGNPMRIKELIKVCDQILHREIPHSILPSVRDEFVQYMGQDDAARSIIGDYFDEYIELVRTTNTNDYTDVSRLRNATGLIDRQLSSFYSKRLRSNLTAALENPRERLRMREATRDYVTFLINTGYDRRHIRKVTSEIFFNDDIQRAGPHLAKKFLNRFDNEERKFVVYVPLKEKDAKAFKNFKFFAHDLINLEALPKSLKNMIESGAHFSTRDRFFKHVTDALDPFAASTNVMQLIKVYSSLTVLESKGLDLVLRPYAFAASKGGRTFTPVYIEPSAVQPTATGISSRSGKSLDRNLSRILDDFERLSRSRIITALTSASLARQTASSENQITLIWSAIETLFGDPPKGSPRLKYYRDCLLNCALINYPWRYTNAVFNQVYYHNQKALNASIREAGIETGIPPARRFQYFLFHPAYAEFHRGFMEKIVNNPLLTQLVFQCYKRFGSGPALRRSIADHAQRVEWQIDRIYRARNDYVHAGQRSPFVEGLAMNSFEYFRTSLQAILYHAAFIKKDFEAISFASIEEIRESLRINRRKREIDIANANLKDADNVSEFLSIFDRR